MWFYIYGTKRKFYDTGKFLTIREIDIWLYYGVTFSNFFDILNHRCSRDPYHSIFDASTWYMADIFFFFFE